MDNNIHSDVTDEVGGSLLLNSLEKMVSIKWWQSKTVWFNVIVTVVGVATSLQGIATFDRYAQLLGLVTVVGNVILRIWFTSAPILATGNPQ